MTSVDEATTLPALFEAQAAQLKDQPFLWSKESGTYAPWSWRRVHQEAVKLSGALKYLGHQSGDRIMLVSENRPEWCVADLGIMMAGCITVPAYTTNTEADHRYLLSHSGAKTVIVSNQAIVKKLTPAMKEFVRTKNLIHFEEISLPDVTHSTISWKQALELGHVQGGNKTTTYSPDDVACIIYTSGTSGSPKGVMLTHKNILTNCKSIQSLMQLHGMGKDEVFLSFLPLSHSYEHTAGQFFPMLLGAQIYYAQNLDQLSNNLAEVKPTLVTCVPRLFEVLRQKIIKGVQRQGKFKSTLFDLAVELGRSKIERGTLPLHKSMANVVVDRLIRKKVKDRFGGRIKAMISGGAPLNPEVGTFFQSLGVPVLQGYGQTEASPVVTVNPPGAPRMDTVGKPLPNVSVKLAEDGEVLVSGSNVMLGYWNDEPSTSSAIVDGWLHTGDIGSFDKDGYLKITDRKKDIIVNSGGDNIAPQKIEGILVLQDEINQAIVYGDKKPYLVALIVVNKDILKDSKESNIHEAVDKAIKRANSGLSAAERIRRYHVMSEDFSVGDGTMTPTLKLRRTIIYNKYQKEINNMYQNKTRD